MILTGLFCYGEVSRRLLIMDMMDMELDFWEFDQLLGKSRDQISLLEVRLKLVS